MSTPHRETDGERKHYPLRDKIAVVTGSSTGIGRAIALEFAEGGASVVVHANRSRKEAEEVRDTIRAQGLRSEVIAADLRDRASGRRLVEESWRVMGHVDIWVNNAGVDILTGRRHKLSYEEKLDALLSLDVAASILLSREVGKRMKDRGSGTILNMGWDQAVTGMEGESGELFGAAKGAVMCFTKSLATALAPEVRVNCLAPGWIRTAWGEAASSYWQERIVDKTPLKRWGRPEDVAQVARFLVSPASEYITGQIVNVNGGGVR